MANIKSLAKDTALYGISSIIGRFLNYLLGPYYTCVFPANEGGYGVITNFYAYTAIVLVILVCGMETTFFRFANKENEDIHKVFSTGFCFVGTLCIIFLGFILSCLTPISVFMGYTAHPEYVAIMAVVISLDAIQALPFCYLRQSKKPLKFISLKLLFIIMNISLNLLYYTWLGNRDVIGAFALNLICTASITLFFIPEFRHIQWSFDWSLFKRMFTYSWPILILGIAGMLNQSFDKIAFPKLYTQPDTFEQLGIYGACVKIAMIMALITQAFRYAYEPFVFSKSRDKNSNETYASAMKYFIIFTLLAFLCVIGYIDILQLIFAPEYRVGIKVVPIVMAAEIMMGIYFNLSFWYKLIDKTIWGAWFSGAGCLVLICINVIFVPQHGFMACAWAGFAGYATAMCLSYYFGQKYYPINYPLKSIGVYILITLFFYLIMDSLPKEWPLILRLGINSLLIIAFIGHILYHDLPLANLPVIGKYCAKKH